MSRINSNDYSNALSRNTGLMERKFIEQYISEVK